jgi:hypothetical protein
MRVAQLMRREAALRFSDESRSLGTARHDSATAERCSRVARLPRARYHETGVGCREARAVANGDRELEMGWLSDLLNVGAGWRRERADYRGARTRAQSQLNEVRAVVALALRDERWPPGAETDQWRATWSAVDPVLSRKMKPEHFGRVATAFRFAEQIQMGLAAGPREFDETAQTPGDDRDFFERARASLDEADEALGKTRLANDMEH